MQGSSFVNSGFSPEAVLKLLQHFISSPNQIKQIHCILLTCGVLVASRWKTAFVYNTLIRSYLNMGRFGTSLTLFNDMLMQRVEPNNLTFPSLIKAASSSFSVSSIALHGQALKWGVLWDPFVQTSFVRLYGEVGNLRSSSKMFDEIVNPCVVACNAMLDAYGRNGEMHCALGLFQRMPETDVVSWTSVINGFAKNGCPTKAIRIFGEMMAQKDVVSGRITPNEATFVSLLSSCAYLDRGGIYMGKQIHGYILRKEIILSTFLGTALIDMYGKAGHFGAAVTIFNQMDAKEVCTWNAVISALACNGRERQALDMFEMMKLKTLQPNGVTFVVILTACARAKLVDEGLHFFQSMSCEYSIVPTPEHYGCVVDLLGRAGLLTEAVNFIKSIPSKPNASVLGALLGACKIHGATQLGNEVGKSLLQLQPQHCAQYVALSSINASEKKWVDAAELREVMIQTRVWKIPAYSLLYAT